MSCFCFKFWGTRCTSIVFFGLEVASTDGEPLSPRVAARTNSNFVAHAWRTSCYVIIVVSINECYPSFFKEAQSIEPPYSHQRFSKTSQKRVHVSKDVDFARSSFGVDVNDKQCIATMSSV
eukprot:810082-Amphidinium_carterae.1